MTSLLELDVSDVPLPAMIKKPTAGQLKEKPDEKGLLYVYSQQIYCRARFTGAGM